MIAVDTNVLVYAHRREVREHARAHRAVAELAEGALPWAIPWPCLYEFWSVVTNPRIWRENASTPAEAWAQLEAWLGSPTLRLLAEADGEGRQDQGFAAILGGLLQRPRVRGPVVHDARVAALCLFHGVEVLLSRDRDFALFPELKVRNPVA